MYNFCAKFYVIFLFVLVYPLFSHAQLITPNFTEYRYKDRIYTYKDLGAVLSTDQLAFSSYQLSRYKRRRGYTNAIVGLGLGVLATPLLFDRSGDYYRMSNAFGIMLVSASVPLLTIAAIRFTQSKKYKQLSIDQFNQSATGFFSIPKNPAYVDVGTTANGIGLIFNF